jgi:hypothetical protein
MKKYIVFLIFIFSCEKVSDENLQSQIISIDIKNSKRANLPDAYSGIEYLFLESSDDFPIIRPFKVKIAEGIIGIEDRGADQYLFYNLEGQPVFKISSSGEGPGEFIRTEDFQIFKDSVVIKDPFLGKYLFFNRKGNFLSERKSMVRQSNFFITNDCIIHYSKNIFEFGPYNFYVEKNGKIDGETDANPEQENIIFTDKDGFVFDKLNNQILFKIPFSTKFTSFNLEGQLNGNYNFDFGPNSLSEIERESLSESEINDVVLSNNLVNAISSLYPMPNGYFLSFGVGFKESHQVYLDRDFNVLHQFKNYKNDIDGMPIRTIPWFVYQDKIGFMIPSGEFYADYLDKFGLFENKDAKNSLHTFVRKYGNSLGNDSYVLVLMQVKESLFL